MTYFSNVTLFPERRWFLNRTFRSMSARHLAVAAAAVSAAISALLGSLIIIFAALNTPGYRNALAMCYLAGFAIASYGTRHMSRTAAIGALLLYVSMNHMDCGSLRLIVHTSIFLALVFWDMGHIYP